ncbi:bifunctional DNA primase/polymerase [Micromonospora fulviviridis]|uniref:Bifunctional DNA primase/polymerase n=1 Tax=Micromonospora fulviviridis TaxID=47860 RepID=A0ABV2VFZ2_9ACTN
MSGELLRAALDYATRGWPVFPIKPDRKAPPLTPNGFKDATTDPATITRWWERWPNANIGIATGDPGPDVLDFDVTAGKPGRVNYRRLRDAGLTTGYQTAVATPRGGLHLYYAGTGQGLGRMPRHGVDFQSWGGYVVAPPSTVGGNPYTVIQEYPPTGVMAQFTAVRALLDPPRPAAPARHRPDAGDGREGLIRWVAAQQEGNRNDALYWAARTAAGEGADGAVFAALVAAAITTGLPEREARLTVASARRGAAA